MSRLPRADVRHLAQGDAARAYVRSLLAVAGRKVFLATILLVSVTIADGVGVLLLLPLLELAGVDAGHGAAGRLSSAVSLGLNALGIRPTLVSVLAIYVLVTSACALLQRWSSLAATEVGEIVLLHLRQRFYRAIINARWVDLCRSRAAELHHALTSELERASGLTYELMSLAGHVLVGAVYLLLAWSLSPITTLVAMVTGGGILLVLQRRTRRAALAGERLSEMSAAMFAATSEHLGALKIAKASAAEERSAALLSILDRNVAQTHIDSGRIFADLRALFQVGSVCVLSVVVFVALAVLRLPAAGVLLLLYLFARLVPRFSSIQDSWQNIAHALPAFARVMAMTQQYESWSETSSPEPVGMELRTEVRLEAVTFAYTRDEPPAAVSEVTLTVPARRTTAIVGPSGAGKSTIADLVSGLLVPDRGRVTVDGVALTPERLRAWRDRIGYVAQDSFLFHDTIRANLRWARPDAGEDDIREALRLAAASDFIDQLPLGLDTIIGDRGACLSGGERQRLALARALLRAPSLLILDEATNAVDAATEARVQHAIEELHERVTILLIAHRLSTIRAADLIHVVIGGRLVESGSWAELLARGGHFAELCRAQGIVLGQDANRPEAIASGRFAHL